MSFDQLAQTCERVAATSSRNRKVALLGAYFGELDEANLVRAVRFLTGQRLQLVHRQHLGTQMRDAGREVSLHRGAMPQATSVSLAAQLLGRFTSVTQAVQRAEMQVLLQEAVNALDPIDREILALRHFEELSNDETAQVLDLKPSAVSNRHIRALKRLRDVLKCTPGFFDQDRK